MEQSHGSFSFPFILQDAMALNIMNDGMLRIFYVFLPDRLAIFKRWCIVRALTVKPKQQHRIRQGDTMIKTTKRSDAEIRRIEEAQKAFEAKQVAYRKMTAAEKVAYMRYAIILSKSEKRCLQRAMTKASRFSPEVAAFWNN